MGNDFYFTHTSYRYAPGLVVWHSRDLVNWTSISHALSDMRDVHREAETAGSTNLLLPAAHHQHRARGRVDLRVNRFANLAGPSYSLIRALMGRFSHRGLRVSRLER